MLHSITVDLLPVMSGYGYGYVDGITVSHFSVVWMDSMPTDKPNSNDSLANPLNWRRYVAATGAGGSSGC